MNVAHNFGGEKSEFPIQLLRNGYFSPEGFRS